MRKNRDRWLELMLSFEGGYGESHADPGGPTKYGVTQATLAEWRGKAVTAEDVKALTVDEAKAIAVASFWNVVQGDELPGGLDIEVADMAYHSGPARAAKTLQRIVGAEVDGYIGPETLKAVRAEPDTAALIEAYHGARMDFLESLPTWATYGKGWTSRLERLLQAALALVESNAVEAKVPTAFVEGGLYGLLVLIVASLPDLWPQLGPNVTGAQQAATAKDWAAFSGYVFAALALIAPAVVRSFVRWRAYREVAR